MESHDLCSGILSYCLLGLVIRCLAKVTGSTTLFVMFVLSRVSFTFQQCFKKHLLVRQKSQIFQVCCFVLSFASFIQRKSHFFPRILKGHTFKSKRIFSELKYLERLQFSLLPAAREPCRLISNQPEKHSFLLAKSLQIWPQWKVVLIGEQSECLDLVAIIQFLRQIYSISLPLGQSENHCICSIISEIHDFPLSHQ